MVVVDDARTTDPRHDLRPDRPRVMTLLMRVLPFLCLAAGLLLMVRQAAYPLGNPDTWFHLRLGHEFLGGWSLSDPGTLSRFATAEWVPTQWSTQVAAALAESAGGVAAVAWLFRAMYLVFVAAVYVVCRRESGPLPAALVTVITLFAASASLSARPQVVSLILIALVAGVWLQTGRDGKPRWWLIPLTWVWATAHGFWSVGVVVGVVWVAGMVLDRRVGPRRALTLAAIPVLSLLAACLTPVGPSLIGSQFAVSDRSDLITEWAPTSFDQMHALVGAAMIAALLVLWGRSGDVTWSRLLLALLAAGLMISAVRLVAVGAVLAAPLLAAGIDRITPAFRARLWRREVVGVLVGTAAAIGVLGLVVPQTADRPANVPEGFAEELAALPPGSAVVVDGPVGAWIEWRFTDLHPTMDGMFDAYELDYLREHQDFVSLEPGWRKFLDDVGARTAVLEREGAIAAAMTRELGWDVVSADGRWVLLEKPS